MNVDLSGKVAIVTGATKGIGRAVAEQLAAVGADVVICARNQKEVESAADEMTAAGKGKVVGIPCNMRDPEQVARLVSTATARFGRVDILINNAGLGIFAPIDEISIDEWQTVIETNLNGPYYASRGAIPEMRKVGGGWIINIGSLAGKHPMAGGSAYNASKFGLLGFSEAMMLDVRHDGIRVSCIMPGSVATRFNGGADSAAWKLQSEDIAEMVLDLIAFPSRALPSRVEMRPSQPPKK